MGAELVASLLLEALEKPRIRRILLALLLQPSLAYILAYIAHFTYVVRLRILILWFISILSASILALILIYSIISMREYIHDAIKNYPNVINKAIGSDTFSRILTTWLNNDINGLKSALDDFVNSLIKDWDLRGSHKVFIYYVLIPFLLYYATLTFAFLTIDKFVPFINYDGLLIAVFVFVVIIISLALFTWYINSGDQYILNHVESKPEELFKYLVNINYILKLVSRRAFKRTTPQPPQSRVSISNTLIYILSSIIWRLSPYVFLSIIEESNKKEPKLQNILIARIEHGNSSNYDFCFDELEQFLKSHLPINTQYYFISVHVKANAKANAKDKNKNKGEINWENLLSALSGFDIDKIKGFCESHVFDVKNRIYKLIFSTWLSKVAIDALVSGRFITFCGLPGDLGYIYLVPFFISFEPTIFVEVQAGRPIKNKDIDCKNADIKVCAVLVTAYGGCVDDVLRNLSHVLHEKLDLQSLSGNNQQRRSRDC